jgi:LPXTG-motif cell wall-anchored protein
MTTTALRRCKQAGLLGLGALAIVIGSMLPASGQDSTIPPPPTVAPTSIARPPFNPGGPQVLGQEQERGAVGSQESLPLTGGDVAGLAAIGLAAIGTGVVLVRRGRRASA